jgi:hypothetical protein
LESPYLRRSRLGVLSEASNLSTQLLFLSAVSGFELGLVECELIPWTS